jgi:hypothetical protein
MELREDEVGLEGESRAEVDLRCEAPEHVDDRRIGVGGAKDDLATAHRRVEKPGHALAVVLDPLLMVVKMSRVSTAVSESGGRKRVVCSPHSH